MASQRDHRDEARAVRAAHVVGLKERDPELTISAIVERTGYARTFVVESLADARDASQHEEAA